MDFTVSSERTSSEPFCINSCDCQHFSGVDAGSSRLNGRVDYQLIFIAEGVCYITENGAEMPVFKNSAILYTPGMPQIYRFRACDSSVSYYVHFCGTQCEKTLSELGLLKSTVIKLREKSEIIGTFDRLISEFHLKKPYYSQNCSGLLISLFALLARSSADNPEGVYDKRLFDICTKMHEHSGENLSVADFARMANLSPSRFAHLFTEKIGISPKQYFLNTRLRRASELLSNTDLPIVRIAELTGFSDSNYFSRIFKKHIGKSPGFYR